MTRVRERVGLGLVATCVLAVALTPVGAGAEPHRSVYVASGNAVTVIDQLTNTVRGTIPVGAAAGAVVASADGTRVYATLTALDAVAVIDATTLTVRGTIPVGDAPSAAVVSPNGEWLYITTTGGVVQVIDTMLGTVVASTPTAGGSVGGMAITADGRTVYVASGPVSVIDTATNTFAGSFLADRSDVEVSPDGSKAYVARTSLFGEFAGTVDVVDTATRTVTASIPMGPLGPMAMAPDGSRLYVGLSAFFAMTSQYTGAIFPGRFVNVIDLVTNTIGAQIDLGSQTAAALVVTPDRSRVYVSVSNAVAAASVNTNRVVALVPVVAPGALGASSDGSGVMEPYVIDAVDDIAPYSSSGGVVVTNVLANDTLGGLRPTVQHVLLTQASTTDPNITLDTATGAVTVASGAVLGAHTLEYQICERAQPDNCDRAIVSVTVRLPYPIDAVDDYASTLPGRYAVANVLVNDTLNGVGATVASVRLTQLSSTAATISLNVSTGAVYVGAGTPAGTHTLAYRICEATSLSNCDGAIVTLTVTALPIDAVDDSGTAKRSGGTAVVNVLANDRFNGVAATTSNVRLFLVSTTNVGLGLNLTTGAVSVAYGTPLGTHQLVYRICEAASLSNCDTAMVTVTVTPYLIDAVNDSVRAYSKPTTAVTILSSVLTNDVFGGQRATTSTVSLTQISSGSPNIVLDSATGAVRLLRKTDSGLYYLVYRICEIGNAANCDQATVTIDLSGSDKLGS